MLKDIDNPKRIWMTAADRQRHRRIGIDVGHVRTTGEYGRAVGVWLDLWFGRMLADILRQARCTAERERRSRLQIVKSE